MLSDLILDKSEIRSFFMLSAAAAILLLCAAAPPAFPAVQAVRLPGGVCAFEAAGKEFAQYHYGGDAPRPFLFPVYGPAGRRVVSMLHPHDPQGHGHHRGIWVAHHDVDGVNFWADTSGARIRTEKWESFENGPDRARAVFLLRWVDAAGRVLMRERRAITLTPLDGGEAYLDLRLGLTPEKEKVTLGKTPFGFAGMRVPPAMRVQAGGRVLDSEDRKNEAGCHWKRSRWADYSGPVAPGVINGVAFFDHPENPRHPVYFHVRDDGWIGAALCYESALEITREAPLKLRYRFYVHAGRGAAALEKQWRIFAAAGSGKKKLEK
jgi:hypothetical protein